MQNAECKISFPLTLLRRLFFLAARHSEQAPSALAPQRQFSVLRSLFSVFRFDLTSNFGSSNLLTLGFSDTAVSLPCSSLLAVLSRLHRLEPAHARHNQSKLCFCSRLHADFRFPFSVPPPPIYYIIRCTHPLPSFCCPFYTLFPSFS